MVGRRIPQTAWKPGSAYTVGFISGALPPSEALKRCLNDEGVRVIESAETPLSGVDAIIVDLTNSDRVEVEAVMEDHLSRTPVIAILAPAHLRAPELLVKAAEVMVMPWEPGELALRIRRLLASNTPGDMEGVIRAEGLVIDTNRYDVFLAGRPVLLTFKEYELLKLMAASPGRVYSREALLEQVWGYQYFGGTRTVDVHIRRLRSKIEDATHNFIDTIWNVGYRFRG